MSSPRTAKALSGWLGSGLVLRPDLDQLDALAPDREALWAWLDGASFLTQDEKRAEAGYGPRVNGGGLKFNPNHAADGRFDFGPDGGVVPIAAPPRGPKGPPPTPAPKPPSATPKPTSKDRSKEPLKDILMPDGKAVEVRSPGAGENVRTVGKGEFDQLKSDLTAGAREVPSPTRYEGKWYQRADGTIVGIRDSANYGATIDVVSSSLSIFPQGYRIHFK